jgi:hypothetical protein
MQQALPLLDFQEFVCWSKSRHFRWQTCLLYPKATNYWKSCQTCSGYSDGFNQVDAP